MLLQPDECLVYLENDEPLPDVGGYTQIARIIRTSDDWYELKLLTNSDGNYISKTNTITVSLDRIVSLRGQRNIESKQIYHLPEFDNVMASNFVIKRISETPLESTSRSALGSGIYGYYFSERTQIEGEYIYLIDCFDSYIIQDKEHGESITWASLETNRYLDRILRYLESNQITGLEEIRYIFSINESPDLITLWKIVFYRTGDSIRKSQLENILVNYVYKYLNDNTLLDTLTNQVIQELPINHIMLELGYGGLISTDAFNNGWDRGCVCYDYSQATVIEGDTALY